MYILYMQTYTFEPFKFTPLYQCTYIVTKIIRGVFYGILLIKKNLLKTYIRTERLPGLFTNIKEFLLHTGN